MYEAILLGRSRSQRDAPSWADQETVNRLIALLEANPYHDGERKGSFMVPPLVLSAFHDGGWRIIYRMVDGRFIEIYSITRVG